MRLLDPLIGFYAKVAALSLKVLDDLPVIGWNSINKVYIIRALLNSHHNHALVLRSRPQ